VTLAGRRRSALIVTLNLAVGGHRVGRRLLRQLPAGAIAMIDTRDVAAVATACLTEPGHGGRTYLITGQQAITGPAAAAEFSSVLGRSVAYIDFPSGQLINAMISTGTPPWLAGDLAMLGEDYAAGNFTRQTGIVQAVTRKHPATFRGIRY
jgi:uncharacterized protein YbjT (DUF2867 family)